MDHGKIELENVQEVISSAAKTAMKELIEAHLATVGGGIADTIPY